MQPARNQSRGNQAIYNMGESYVYQIRVFLSLPQQMEKQCVDIAEL